MHNFATNVLNVSNNHDYISLPLCIVFIWMISAGSNQISPCLDRYVCVIWYTVVTGKAEEKTG